MSIPDFADIRKAVISKVELPSLNSAVNVFVKREDLIHPDVSGNKWYKLKYNLAKAREENYDTLLTFGGAYSNHIYSTAAAGNILGFKTIGIIRGEEHLPLNPTLNFAVENGMRLVYVSRSEYRKRYDEEFLNRLRGEYGKLYIIPEGGTNELAVKGAAEISAGIDMDFDYICTACGTGGTLAGIIAGLKGTKKALGFAVLKGASFLNENVKNLLMAYDGMGYGNWQINLDYHFGGYARINRELVEFIIQFEELNGFRLDPVYTGKMMFGIRDLTRKNFFQNGQTVLAVHTGGLQGIDGMKEKIEKIMGRI